MSMTASDYAAIADGFKFSMPNPETSHPDAVTAWQMAVYQVAGRLAMMNTDFDQDGFYRACGIDPEDA